MSAPVSSRDRLLEAAIEVIDAEGEAGVKVDRVAEMAGVAKPSIYRHFGDRDGLIVAAQAERYLRSIVFQVPLTLEQAVECDTADDFARLLFTVMSQMATPEGEARRRLRIQVLASASTRPQLQEAIRAAHERAVDEFATTIAYAQRRGWASNEFPATALVEWWLALILGRHVVEQYGRAGDADAWRQVAARAVQLLLFGDATPTP